jgi:two-component system response regulator PilR (NtrC family)
MARILVVDDEKSLCQLLEIAFRKDNHRIETVSSGEAALKKINSQIYDIIISDIVMPHMSGIELLEQVRQSGNTSVFLLVTAVPTVDTAIQALNLGADRYVIKSDKLIEELKIVIGREMQTIGLREENLRLRREMLRVFAVKNIIGKSQKTQAVLEVVRTVAPTTSTVLITGESGTGKELVARAIHEASARREMPFVSINCGAFPETLLESELFGYLRGAFTGAYADKKGIFEAASRGTLFLDEIGDTTPSMQVKLLRVLQERKIRPLGGTSDIPVDVRLIASTNRDLMALVSEGKFREDFYYRVSVIPVHIPPLRERREDIDPLARHFLHKYSATMSKALRDFDAAALAALEAYAWPGNVRELENAIERAVALSEEEATVVCLHHLPEFVRLAGPSPFPTDNEALVQIPKEGLDFERSISRVESQYILGALRAAGGVRRRAADLLHMSYRSFRHYAKKHGI